MTENPYEASQVSPEEPDAPTGEAPKIAGLLLLPAFGLIVGPVRYSISLVREINSGVLKQVGEVNGDFPGYQTAWVVISILELLLIGFQLYIALRYFERHTIVPRLMIVMLLANVGLAILTTVWFYFIFGEFENEDGIAILTAVLVACVWIPYFIFSKRVKATFIVDPAHEPTTFSDE